MISSLLVRQAMLRQMQINQKYDTMSPRNRQEFDEQNATCLNGSLDRDYIVLRVWGGPPLSPTSALEAGRLNISGRVKVSPTNKFPIYNFQAPVPCGGESFPWQYIPTAVDKLNDDYNRTHSSPVVSPDNRQLAPIPAIDYSRAVFASHRCSTTGGHGGLPCSQTGWLAVRGSVSSRRDEFLYRYPGWFVRLLLKSGATRWIAHATVLPLYYLAHKLKSKNNVTWQGAKNLFYYYFASPHVAFLSRENVEALSAAHGMELLRYDENPNQNVHCFEFRKKR